MLEMPRTWNFIFFKEKKDTENSTACPGKIHVQYKYGSIERATQAHWSSHDWCATDTEPQALTFSFGELEWVLRAST